MQNYCITCKGRTNSRCSRCKRYYCNVVCRKNDPGHNQSCKAPPKITMKGILEANGKFGKKIDPKELFNLPVYKGEYYLSIPISDRNPPHGVFDVHSEDMKDFCVHLGYTPKSLEEMGFRYWFKVKDYPMIIGYLSPMEMLEIYEKYRAMDA